MNPSEPREGLCPCRPSQNPPVELTNLTACLFDSPQEGEKPSCRAPNRFIRSRDVSNPPPPPSPPQTGAPPILSLPLLLSTVENRAVGANPSPRAPAPPTLSPGSPLPPRGRIRKIESPTGRRTRCGPHRRKTPVLNPSLIQNPTSSTLRRIDRRPPKKPSKPILNQINDGAQHGQTAKRKTKPIRSLYNTVNAGGYAKALSPLLTNALPPERDGSRSAHSISPLPFPPPPCPPPIPRARVLRDPQETAFCLLGPWTRAPNNQRAGAPRENKSTWKTSVELPIVLRLALSRFPSLEHGVKPFRALDGPPQGGRPCVPRPCPFSPG